MIKVGLIGLGFMGRAHLENYIRLESEGFPIKLVAICDIDKSKFDKNTVRGNIDVGNNSYDFSRYNLYYNVDEMLDNEELDYLDITLPTYLHADVAVKALDHGLHVLCEKPMALSSKDCARMIDASKKNDRKLMIAHCLRFWPAYEYLKECVVSEKYGKAVSGYFFRGGSTPIWSYRNWLLQKDKSGGCLFDQHVHDIDTINWLFGKPDSVSTVAKVINEGNGYDIVSTNYLYDDGKVINAQDDWTLNGDYGFDMKFRVNFENSNLVFEYGVLKVNPKNEKGFIPELPKDNGYYREMVYFISSLLNDTIIETAAPESTMETIVIAEAEQKSADNSSCFMQVSGI